MASATLNTLKSTRQVSKRVTKPISSVFTTLYQLLMVILVFAFTLASMLTWKNLRGHTVKNGAKRKNNMNWFYHQFMKRLILTINPFWERKVEFVVPSEELQKETYIYCCNHTSYADFIMLSGVGDLNYVGVGKSDILDIPLVGHVFKNNGFLPVVFEKKADGRWGTKKGSTERLMKLAKKDLNAGVSIILFPEGQITLDYETAKFKPGFFKLAIETDTPVVPMASWGNAKMWPMAKKGVPDTKMYPGTSYVKCGTPMEPLHPTEVANLDVAAITELVAEKYKMSEDELENEDLQINIQAIASYNADPDLEDEKQFMDLTTALFTELIRRRVVTLRLDCEEWEAQELAEQEAAQNESDQYYADIMDNAVENVIKKGQDALKI